MTDQVDTVTPGHIGFQLNAHIRGASFNPRRPTGASFETGPPFNMSFSLKPHEKDDGGFDEDCLDYRIRTELPASVELIAFVRELNAGRYDPFGDTLISLPLIVDGKVLIAEDGFVRDDFSVGRELVPYEGQTMKLPSGSSGAGLSKNL